MGSELKPGDQHGRRDGLGGLSPGRHMHSRADGEIREVDGKPGKVQSQKLARKVFHAGGPWGGG